MKKLLNTLYVTQPDAYLSKDGLNLVVSIKQREVFRIPIVNLEGVATFGQLGASPGAMKLCVENNVSLTFLTPSGRYIARIQGPTKGNVLLRRRQYLLSEDDMFSLALSRIFIAGKICNCRNILRRAIRDNGPDQEIERVVALLERRKDSALSAISAERLLGIEGDAAAEYFSVFNHLIIQQREDFPFETRNRRPPRDEVNVMLSFVYTMMANDIGASLESVGLDPYVGYMHRLRPGRQSLALDVMEEFRSYLGDRLVLSLINRKQITKNDFIRGADDAPLLTDNGRKVIISAYQERKKREIQHPFLNEKVPIGLLPFCQSMLLARYLRGDLDNYPVFIVK